MSLLSCLLPCLLLLFPGQTDGPVQTWLNTMTTPTRKATYSNESRTVKFNQHLTQNFSGDIAIISGNGETVYQGHHQLGTGKVNLILEVSHFEQGRYLLVLHDFNTRDLRTSELVYE